VKSLQGKLQVVSRTSTREMLCGLQTARPWGRAAKPLGAHIMPLCASDAECGPQCLVFALLGFSLA
jgi:hypothetical protein